MERLNHDSREIVIIWNVSGRRWSNVGLMLVIVTYGGLTLTLAVPGSTLESDSDVYRRQILTSNVNARTERFKYAQWP